MEGRAQNSLTIGLLRVYMGRAIILSMEASKGDFSAARDPIEQGLKDLRRAGRRDNLPRGLLAHAALSRLLGESNHAEADLAEAMTIVQEDGLKLHEADCHLEYARFHQSRGKPESARQSLAKAREMIDRMDYHRRDLEADQLENGLAAS